jgi:hypothetical protein
MNVGMRSRISSTAGGYHVSVRASKKIRVHTKNRERLPNVLEVRISVFLQCFVQLPQASASGDTSTIVNDSYLVDEVDHRPNTSGHEGRHHPLVFVASGQVAFNEQQHG